MLNTWAPWMFASSAQVLARVESMLDASLRCRVGEMVLVDLPFLHAASGASRTHITARVFDRRTMGVLRPFPDADGVEGNAVRARPAWDGMLHIHSRL